jgi:hypothetical protein
VFSKRMCIFAEEKPQMADEDDSTEYGNKAN